MTEILHIFQVRIQEAHEFNYGLGISFPHFPVFDREQVFNHPLDMAAVFPHNQVITRSVIFHNVKLFEELSAIWRT
jgi:hypothetical protein